MVDTDAVDTSMVRESLPGEHLELAVRRLERRRLQLTDGQLSLLQEATTVKALVRSTADGFTGSVTLGRADRAALRWALGQARMLRAIGRVRLNPLPVAGPRSADSTAWAAIDECRTLSPATAVAELTKLNKHAAAAKAVRAVATWDQAAQVVTIANSSGTDIVYPQPETSVSLALTLTSDGDAVTAIAGRTGRTYSDLDAAEICSEAIGEARCRLRPARSRGPSGGTARPEVMIIGPRAWSRLFGQISAVFYGDRVDVARSGLREPGSRIWSPGLDLVDDGTDDSVLARAPCDDEGTAARRTPIVADGVVRTLLHDRSSADERAGECSTGNGWMVPAAASVPVAVAGSVLRLEGRAVPLERLAARADLILYVTGIDDGAGRGVDPINDSVRLSMSGWLVRGGEPAESVSRATSGLRLSDFLLGIGGTSDVARYYRLSAGSTQRSGPAVRSTHVLIHDLPIELGGD